MKPLNFREDSFDLNEYKEKAHAAVRTKARNKSIRRQISLGKIIIAIIATVFAVALFYAASVFIPMF